MSIAYVSIALFLLITFGVNGIILLQVSPFVSLFPIIPPPPPAQLQYSREAFMGIRRGSICVAVVLNAVGSGMAL